MTKARIAEETRKTKETDITMTLNIDGTGRAKLDYPVGFMAHMLNSFSRHGLFDLDVRASGDLEVDQHHLVEDTGIVLGECFAKALGDRSGIKRVGNCLCPMDETLARASVDISGRPFLVFNGKLSGAPLVFSPALPGGAADSGAFFQADTVADFWHGFVAGAGFTLHLDVLRGRSDHHKIEALFKAAAKALREACEIDGRAWDSVPSVKGVLCGGPPVLLA